MLELPPAAPGTTRESRGPFDRRIVTDLHVHAHDFPSAVWLTFRRGGCNAIRRLADGIVWACGTSLLSFSDAHTKTWAGRPA